MFFNFIFFTSGSVPSCLDLNRPGSQWFCPVKQRVRSSGVRTRGAVRGAAREAEQEDQQEAAAPPAAAADSLTFRTTAPRATDPAPLRSASPRPRTPGKPEDLAGAAGFRAVGLSPPQEKSSSKDVHGSEREDVMDRITEYRLVLLLVLELVAGTEGKTKPFVLF